MLTFLGLRIRPLAIPMRHVLLRLPTLHRYLDKESKNLVPFRTTCKKLCREHDRSMKKFQHYHMSTFHETAAMIALWFNACHQHPARNNSTPPHSSDSLSIPSCPNLLGSISNQSLHVSERSHRPLVHSGPTDAATSPKLSYSRLFRWILQFPYSNLGSFSKRSDLLRSFTSIVL